MKLLSVDDHDLFREGLRQVLRGLPGDLELLEAAHAEAALTLLEREGDVGLVLLDLGLPDTDGLSLLGTLRERFPLVAVVVVSANEDPATARAAIERGASGFIPKTSDRTLLLQALELVLSGGVYVPPFAMQAPEPSARQPDKLTPRQREVAELMTKGLTNKEIASVLGIAAGTVKLHVAAVLAALDVSNRTEAVMAMVELGLFADKSEP